MPFAPFLIPALAGVAAAPAGPSKSWRGFTSLGSGTANFTINNVDIGDPAADRVVVVGMIIGLGGGSLAISAVTVNGINAPSAVFVLDTSAWGSLALNYAEVPTGSTASISVTSNIARSYGGMGVWALYGLNAPTPVDAQGNTIASTNAISQTLNTDPGGFAFGNLSMRATITSVTGLSIEAGVTDSAWRFASAVTSGGPLTFAANASAASRSAIAAASFR